MLVDGRGAASQRDAGRALRPASASGTAPHRRLHQQRDRDRRSGRARRQAGSHVQRRDRSAARLPRGTAVTGAGWHATATTCAPHIDSLGGALVSRHDLRRGLLGAEGAIMHAQRALRHLAMSEQMVDNHTRVDHREPHCHSFELFNWASWPADTANCLRRSQPSSIRDAQKSERPAGQAATCCSRRTPSCTRQSPARDLCRRRQVHPRRDRRPAQTRTRFSTCAPGGSVRAAAQSDPDSTPSRARSWTASSRWPVREAAGWSPFTRLEGAWCWHGFPMGHREALASHDRRCQQQPEHCARPSRHTHRSMRSRSRGMFPILAQRGPRQAPGLLGQRGLDPEARKAVIEAMDDCYRAQHYANVHRGVHQLDAGGDRRLRGGARTKAPALPRRGP